MKIGFTGTRKGMTAAQHQAVIDLVRGAVELHHGDCVGADDETATIAKGIGSIHIVCHPPVDSEHRAWSWSNVCRARKTHFARNRDIVNETDMLIATPWQNDRPAKGTGGGTWYTIEYAEKVGKPVTIIWPDGRVE